MFKRFLVLTAGAFAGNFIADQFVVKNSPDDETGFVAFSDGPFGLDSLAKAAVIGASIWLATKIVKG